MSHVMRFSRLPGLASLLLWALPAGAGELRVGTSLSHAQPLVTLAVDGASGGEWAGHAETRTTFDLGYGHYGVSLSSPFPSSWGKDVSRLGRFPAKGWSDDLRAFYHGNAWGLEAYHRNVKGFSGPPESPDATRPEERPDMSLRSASATLYRSLIPESRVYHLSEGRSVSDGDFLPDFLGTMAVSHMRLKGKQPLAGTSTSASPRFDGIESIEVTSFALGGGVCFASRTSGLYFDPAFFVGFGPQYREWGDRSDWAWNLVKTNLRVNMGFRSRWFDLGSGFERESHTALAGPESADLAFWTLKAGLNVYL